MIGRAHDIVVRGGRLFYLDTEYSEVRVYDHSASLQAIVGRGPGEGAGEFSNPSQLAVSQDGSRIFVWDQSNRLQIFLEQESDYALEQSFRTELGSRAYGDLCVMDGHVYVSGYTEGMDAVIHKYTFSGEYIDSFGATYKSPNLYVRDAISTRGRLVCNAFHDIVGYVSTFFPILTGYSKTGEILWQVKFPDMKIRKVEQRLTESGLNAMRYSVPREGESWGIYLSEDPVGESFIAHYTIQGESSSVRTRHYFKVNAQSGLGNYIGQRTEYQDRPTPVLRALDAEYAYTSYSFPFPQIAIYDRSEVLPE